MFQLNFVIDKKYTHPVSQSFSLFIHSFLFLKKNQLRKYKNSKVEMAMFPPRF